MVLGLGKHSSVHSCYACTWARNTPVTQKQVTKKRTAGSIRKHFEAREEVKGQARDFFSAVAKPISQLPEGELIESFVTPPELHMLLGIFAWLFTVLQKCFKDPDKIYDWPRHFNIIKSRFYGGGGAYNGNSCRELLRCNTWLLNIITSEFIKHGMLRDAKAAHEAIARLNSLVSSMFGKPLGLLWKSDHSRFRKSILALFKFPKLQLKYLTPKLHVLLEHAPAWCEKHKCGLGKCSEQSFETSHHDFKLLWEQRFKITSLKSPAYKKRLLQAVLTYATQHVPASDALAFLDDIDSAAYDVENDEIDREVMSEIINN